MAANQYPVILYLNQKYALDIMAMMEGGFSQIETQTNTRANQESQSHKVAGGIGLSNFFGLIRMSLDSDSMKSGQQCIRRSKFDPSRRSDFDPLDD
jgi:hypothetical protein